MNGQTDITLSEYIQQIHDGQQYFLADEIKDRSIEIATAMDFEGYLEDEGYQIVPINQYQKIIVPSNLSIARPIADQDQQIMTIGQPSNQSLCRVSGKVVASDSGETIIGATISNQEDGLGTVTNYNGNYEILCQCGQVQRLKVQSIGYQMTEIECLPIGDGTLDVTLYQEAEMIEGVVISTRQSNDNIQSSISGLSQLSMQEIKKLPSLLGEPDIMKSLLTLSGVTNAGEGASGVNVRGGNADQNLILLDNMTFFNPTHSFGFFSALHPEMVSGLELYKGVMPVEYGGRLSSVLQTESTKANSQEWKAKVGLGLISTKAFVEGPLWKDNTAIAFASRISHINWLLRAIDNPEINQSRTRFYDVHCKVTHRIIDPLKITAQGYQSRDGFRFSEQFDLEYLTRNGSVELNYLATDKLSVQLSSSIGTYESILSSLTISQTSQLNTGINHLKHRAETTYDLDGNWLAKGGVEYTSHTVNPGVLKDTNQSIISESQSQHAISLSPYASLSGQFFDRINLTAGIRYPMYQRLGQDTEVQYVGNPVLAHSEGSTNYADGEQVYSYNQLEPRLGLTIQIIPSLSLKASYNRTSQFISQISNTASPTPIDFWVASNQYLQPMVADAYSLGIYKNWNADQYETSIEAYYKDINQVTETIDFADIIANPLLETQLLQGIGRTYGLELNLTKSLGSLSGKVNYTYSRSLRKIENENPELQINNGDWYSANFDKPHILNINAKYEIGKRSAVSMAFTYSTGRPVTAPISVYENFDVIGIYVFSDRNAFRIPNYHRLDIAYDYHPNIRKNKSYKTFWTFGIYNVYGRNNAYSVFFDQENGSPPKANSLAIIGVPIPSITLNVEFE